MQPFTLLIKPSGSDCNIDCQYCFYKCRAPEVGQGRQRMSDEVLERLVKDYMELRFPLAGFAWQGGEPTLMGLDFYKKVVELQKKYGVSGQEVAIKFLSALVSTGLKSFTTTTASTIPAPGRSIRLCGPSRTASSTMSSTTP